MTTETSGSHDTESGDKESRDPIHIGEQCSTATCGTVDFLPITCSFCNSVFCKTHHTPHSHDCDRVPEKQRSSQVTFEASKPCHVCLIADIINVVCEECGSVCCMSHRTLEQHTCTSLSQPCSRPLPPKLLTSTAKGVVPKRKGAKSVALERKVMLMKMKNKSSGLSSIPQDERIYINVARNTTKEPCYYHFSRSWQVGRCVDVVAQHLKMRNENDKAGCEELVMSYNDLVLPMSELLSEVTESGDTVVLSYLPP